MDDAGSESVVGVSEILTSKAEPSCLSMLVVSSVDGVLTDGGSSDAIFCKDEYLVRRSPTAVEY